MQLTLSASAVIEPVLRDAIQRSTGLDDLRAGRHIIRDAQGRKLEEVIIRKLWAVRVQPPVTPPACIVAYTTDHQLKVAFAVPEDLESFSIGTSLLQFDDQQADPVGTALTSLDLWSGDNCIPMTGCSYSFFVCTMQMHIALRFSNPRDPNRTSLQKALLEVARWFTTGEERTAVTEFIDRWQAATVGTTS